MYQDAIIAGFGGQGVMLIGNLLAYAGMDAGLNVTYIPVYGPEMRGGTANCTVVVSDDVIRDVHARFLNDPTATDVITFPHGDGIGEIIVSFDTAIRQASEFGEPVFRELFRYMVHGLLHLHGYIDTEPEERERMFSCQEPLVRKFGATLVDIPFTHDRCSGA